MTLLSCISAEKTIRLPLRSSVGIRHRNKQLADDFLVERRRRQIHWLIDIVRWGVVALSQPIFKWLLLRRSRVESNIHDQSWNSVTNEVVLIAADKQIPQRLGIRLRPNSVRLCNLAGPITEVRVSQPLHSQHLQRNNRQKHIDIDVRNDRLRINRWMSRKILRSQQSFLFSRDKHQKNS